LFERGAVAAVSPSIGDIHRLSNALDDRMSIRISEVAAGELRLTHLPADVLKVVYQRAQLKPITIDSLGIAEQQRTADLYVRAGVIKTTLDVTPTFDAQFTAH